VRGERGFALVAALWLLVAISAVALELSVRARDRRLAAGNVAEHTRSLAAAQGGVEHARARLERRLGEAAALRSGFAAEAVFDPWYAAAALFPDSVALGETRYRVSIGDVGARLNLNRAGEEELRRLFTALRVDAGRADRVAQAILDWRDPDHLHRARGAEREDYLRRASPVLPRDAPFQELSELLHVKGMTPELYERARPYLTLLGTGQVNLNAADLPVLAALPGMTEEAVGVIVRQRRSRGRITDLTALSQELSPGARALFLADFPALLSRTTLETREVEIHSEGWTAGGRVRARVQALMVRSGSTAFLVWRRTP
jgi:general secretion pathway protein K